ncbi:MAG: beta-ketoacyl synthase N-terminal-like domain-containing protein [Pirellulales bacterium]
MPQLNEIVITGMGCVTPIGIGRDEFWSGLKVGRCAIEVLHSAPGMPDFPAAVLKNFDAKQYVTPRKALKVMVSELQTAYAASRLAWLDAGLTDGHVDPDRVGVLFGSETFCAELPDLTDAVAACFVEGKYEVSRWGSTFPKTITPLWMLKSLPNMPACHVGIAVDARGPNNSIVMEEVSGLLALQEAAITIERGAADMMVVGSTGNRVNPSRMLYRIKQHFDESPNQEEPFCAPYDLHRRGAVPGEGAGAIILESREHAERRGVVPIARLAGFSNCFAPPDGVLTGSRRSIAAAAANAIKSAGIAVSQIAHVSSQAFSHRDLDANEAQALESVIGSTPVVGYSSYFGQLKGGCGIVELIASMLSLEHKTVLPTLGFSERDPACPVRVLKHAESSDDKDYLMKLNFNPQGQAAAVVVQCLK